MGGVISVLRIFSKRTTMKALLPWATALFLLCLAQSAAGLWCHNCRGSDCKTPGEKIPKKECSSLLQVKSCVTVFSDEKQSEVLYKDCGPGLGLEQEEGCFNAEFKLLNIKLAHVCACDSNLCNGATVASIRPLVAILSALGVLWLGRTGL